MTDIGPDGPELRGGPDPLGRLPGAPRLPIVSGGGLAGRPEPRHRCTDTSVLILRVLEGIPDPALIDAVRASLRPCRPCVDALEVEIRFKITMSQRATDKAPPWLQLRISETLQRVDLGDIEITDL